MKLIARAGSIFAGVLAVMASGCTIQPSNPFVQQQNVAVPTFHFSPQAKPARCKGQKTTKKYASVSARLSTRGGSLCIPVFHGLGGAIRYPGATPAVKVTVLSTTIDNNYPYPGTGAPLLYVVLTPSAGTTFGTRLRSGAGLIGKGIQVNAPYTTFTSMLEFGLWHQGNECYSVAKAGKRGPTIGDLGALLSGFDLSGSALLFEVYPNQQSSTQC